jgi:hypothetical protein
MAGKLVIFHDPEQKPFHFAEHTPGLAHPVFAAGIQKA